MAERNNPANKTRSKQQNMPKKPLATSKSPVVLIPATPAASDEIPVATEDEASPTLPPPPSPNSYARVAARPAARTNVVVWPRNTAATSPARVTPPLGQGSPKHDRDVDGLQHPASEFIWNGAVLADAAQESNISSSVSSLPSSSPIQFTDSATATPTLLPSTAAAHSTPTGRGLPASQGIGSYEDFWAHVRTPAFAEANIPSALQTPRILTPRANDIPPEVLWPASATEIRVNSVAGANDVENCPPPARSDSSHPPVVGRLRKRRRGTSPVSGERMRKSARRKAKGKARETTGNEQDVFGPSLANPWASSTERPRPEAASNNGKPTSVSLPSQPLAVANQTPYEDFSRAASATTSFYGRFNESGSYPTPHRLSDSPTPSSSAAPSAWPASRQSSSLPDSSAPPASARHPSSVSSRHSMEVDDVSGEAQERANAGRALLERRTSNDSPTDPSRSGTERPGCDLQRRLRDTLSDPTSRDERASTYRSPSMEEVPEEGEIHSAWRQRWTSNPRDRAPNRAFRRDSFSLPSISESPWRDQTSSPYPRSQSRSQAGFSFTRNDNSARAHDENWRMSTQTSSVRNDPLPTRESTHQQLYTRSPARMYESGSHHSGEFNPRASTQSSANRINGLDVFDVGEDDNLPDAVRRGGSIAEGDDENPTPIPLEGDPEVHRHDPEAHLQGLSDTWVQEVWADPVDTSVTLSTFNPRFTRSYGTNRRTASDLRRSIGQITGESNFLVIAPDQAPSYRGRGPVEWAITGLKSEGVERILRRRVWSFKSITFFPRRRALDNPRWILALEGFLEDNVGIIEAAVRSTFERPQVRQRIIQMIRANPEFADIPTEEALRRIMATLRVSVYTLDNETVVANVFLRSPTQSIRAWRRWIQELRDLTFGSFHTAIARVRRISSCAGCLGVDHPSHLCPFTRLLGWNGPETAGGSSYSADGRERRGHQQSDSAQGSTELHTQRRYRPQSSHNTNNAHAGPSRSRSSRPEGDWEGHGRERSREGPREQSQGRLYNHDRRGAARRGKKDGTGPTSYGRDKYRKDERR